MLHPTHETDTLSPTAIGIAIRALAPWIPKLNRGGHGQRTQTMNTVQEKRNEKEMSDMIEKLIWGPIGDGWQG